MRGKLFASLGCAVLAGTLAGAGGVAPASATPPPYGQVHLTVYQGEHTGGPVLAETDLRCNPDGGGHPDPAAACAALAAAGGDPARIPATSGACTAQYDPVTAVAEGYWAAGTRRIDFTRTYGNRCALRLAKAPLFDF